MVVATATLVVFSVPVCGAAWANSSAFKNLLLQRPAGIAKLPVQIH